MKEIIVDPADIKEWRDLDALERSYLSGTLAVGSLAVAFIIAATGLAFTSLILILLGISLGLVGVVITHFVGKVEQKVRDACRVAKVLLLRKYAAQHHGVVPEPHNVKLPEEWEVGSADAAYFMLTPAKA